MNLFCFNILILRHQILCFDEFFCTELKLKYSCFVENTPNNPLHQQCPVISVQNETTYGTITSKSFGNKQVHSQKFCGFFFQMAGLWHTTFLIHCKILAGSNHQLSLTLTLWMDDCGLRVELWECVGSGDWDEGHSILDLLEARYILDLLYLR